MDDRDRALLAEIRERDRAWADEKWRWPAPYRTAMDRRELLRIVAEFEVVVRAAQEWWPDRIGADEGERGLMEALGELEHLLRERDTLAEDRADDAAATEATKGRWGS